MAIDLAAAMAEARELGLFRPQGAFEVHCSNCHARLDPQGDCPNCGLIGRPESEIEQRGRSDAPGAQRLLSTQIARRKAYKPAKASGAGGA